MAVQRITERLVATLKAPEKDAFVWDDLLVGFGVKITPAVRRTFVVQYRMPGLGRTGAARRLTIGECGRLTVADARKKARRELAKVAQGSDPAAERAANKVASTVSELGIAFLADAKVRRKANTAIEYARLWKRHVLPALGSKRVVEVSQAEVRKLHRRMHETPYQANRVLALLGSFFSFAAKEGVRARHDNPAQGVDQYPEHGRDRFLLDPEFTRLGDALRKAEKEGLPPAPEHRRKVSTGKRGGAKHRNASTFKAGAANPFAVAAIRLLALTACREGEILSLRWDAVDFDRGFLRLSDTKTGRSVRALGAAAAEVLHALPRIEGSPFVLPGARPDQHLKEIRRVWYSVRHAAGLSGLRLHDLRHSFASVAASGGDSMVVIRALLGHARIATTERYAHLADDPVKRAADRASGDIASFMKGDVTPVTPLRAVG